MPCPFCELGVCFNPSHGVVKLWQPKERVSEYTLDTDRVVPIFDINRSSRRPSTSSSSGSLLTRYAVPHYSEPQLQFSVKRSVPLHKRVTVSEYDDGWERGSDIVADAQDLHEVWVKQAKLERGVDYKSPDPPENKCSGNTWGPIDEGMDVSAEIAAVDRQLNRAGSGVTLWRASCFGHFGAVGILITQHAHEHGDEAELAIRWLIGHPTKKGAGSALMDKVDALHQQRRYRKYPMHVTAAASSVSWYQSKGFQIQMPARCESEDVPCGCVDMLKPPIESAYHKRGKHIIVLK